MELRTFEYSRLTLGENFHSAQQEKKSDKSIELKWYIRNIFQIYLLLFFAYFHGMWMFLLSCQTAVCPVSRKYGITSPLSASFFVLSVTIK